MLIKAYEPIKHVTFLRFAERDSNSRLAGFACANTLDYKYDKVRQKFLQ
jgi:hypothetical protein